MMLEKAAEISFRIEYDGDEAEAVSSGAAKDTASQG
jgi:hypothetical protein